MDIFTILYSFILVIIIAASATLAYTCYLKRKSPFFLVLGIMFTVNILSDIIINMTEMIRWFSDFYNSLFMTIPSLKTVLILSHTACIIYLITLAAGEKVKITHISVLIIHAIALLFIPMLPNGALKVWVYYLPSQLIQIGLSVYALKFLKKATDKSQVQNAFCKLMMIAIIFSIFILIEDSFIISKMDIYTDATILIHNRNYSEDILSIISSVFAIRYCYLFLFETKDNEDQKASICDVNPNIGIKEDFCLEFDLTSREKDVLLLLIQNKNNQDICDTLNISIGTVKAHIHNIFYKVNVSRRDQLILKYETYDNGTGTVRQRQKTAPPD